MVEHSCEECGREFFTSNSLRTHRRILTGEKTWIAWEAFEKRFNRKDVLKENMRTYGRLCQCKSCLDPFASTWFVIREPTLASNLTCAVKQNMFLENIHKNVRFSNVICIFVQKRPFQRTHEDSHWTLLTAASLAQKPSHKKQTCFAMKESTLAKNPSCGRCAFSSKHRDYHQRQHNQRVPGMYYS